MRLFKKIFNCDEFNNIIILSHEYAQFFQLIHKCKALSKEHSEDWDKNVASHCKDVGDFQFCKRNEQITYNPNNEIVGNNVLARIINIKESGRSRAAVLDAFNEIAKVLKAINSPQARRVYINEFGSPDSEDIALIYPFSSFAAFEKSKGLPPGFQEEFEKINGLGSFYRMVGSVLDEHSDDRYDEVRVMVQ